MSNQTKLFQRMLPVILKYTPSGASTRQIIHYGQLMRVNHFRQYDYGYFGNHNRYGTFRPPNYNLEQITAPVALHYGSNDWLAAVVDVQRLASRLPNLVEYREVPHPRFNHLDFVWARNVSELLYNRVLDLMNSNNDYESRK